MSDSTFHADLDALVRGESLASNDELTRFVSDLYGEEQNVTMPQALKLRIASDLGLTQTEETTIAAAPVSRRTARATHPPVRSSRPWIVGLSIAAAMLIMITGVLQWGPMGDNGEPDNQFLLSSPAVPTVAITSYATPDVSPEPDLAWQQPVTPEECAIDDSGELPAAAPGDFDSLPARDNLLTGPANSSDSHAANEVVRQYLACDFPPALLSDQAAIETALSGEGFSPFSLATLERQFADGMSLSQQLEEHGITPNDVVIPGNSGAGEALIPNPELAYMLQDGRMLIPGFHPTTNPSQAIGSGVLLTYLDGNWKIDDQVPLCIGECDGVFADLESMYMDALWLTPIAGEECVGNDILPTGISIEAAAAIKSRQYRACEMDGNASQLQGPEYQLIAASDAQPLSEEIASLHRQNGEAPGSLQRIAGGNLWPEGFDVPTDPWSAFQPGSVVMLDDGRVAVLESTVRSPEGVIGSGRTSPVVTAALVWTVDGDSWLLDEDVTVCLGNCDSYWNEGRDAGDTGAIQATPVTLLIPETCDVGDGFVADYTSHPQMPVNLRPGPGNLSGISVATIPSGTPLQYLCENEETTNHQTDRMDEGQVWLRVRTPDGTEGWIREIDVREFSPESD